MKKVLLLLIFIFLGNLLKSQKIDSLISLKNSPFLTDLIHQPFISEAVEINNPFAGNKEYEMVGSLGLTILKMEKKAYLYFNSSGLLYEYVKSTDSIILFKRLDKTNNFKYNIDAYLFSYQGKIFNLGGYGFWRTTGTLRCFNEKNREWDVEPTNEEIHIPIKSTLTSYYPEQSLIYIPFQVYRNEGVKAYKKNLSQDNHVYALNLKSKDWELKGQTNPTLVSILNESPWQLSTDNGLIFSHNNVVYQLRYPTNEVYVYNESSSLSQTLERIYYNHYKYYAKGTMYYMEKSTGTYDSLKIPLDKFVKSNIKIWRNKNTNYAYIIVPVIVLAAFFTIRRYKNKKNHSKPLGQPNIEPVIRFSEIEKQLIQLLLGKSKENKTTTITEINYILGIKDKNISLQKKVRSEVMNSINEKFNFLNPNDHQLISNTRSQEDKRYFEYYIDEQHFGIIEKVLTEDI